MKSGTMYKFGDIVLAEVPVTDSPQIKSRSELVVFEEFDNVTVAETASKGILPERRV